MYAQGKKQVCTTGRMKRTREGGWRDYKNKREGQTEARTSSNATTSGWFLIRAWSRAVSPPYVFVQSAPFSRSTRVAFR